MYIKYTCQILNRVDHLGIVSFTGTYYFKILPQMLSSLFSLYFVSILSCFFILYRFKKNYNLKTMNYYLQIKGKESENSYQELKRSRKGQAHTNTRKLNRDISTGTAVFLNQNTYVDHIFKWFRTILQCKW